MAGNQAPYLTLWYDEKAPGDILINDVCVPSQGSTKCTYYCCLNWNLCGNGGGYCGLQDHPNGKCYIFSIWDPHNSADPITPVFKAPGTWTERFANEGTGLKSMNFELGWSPDQWYTIVTRRWDHQGHTRFGCWVQDQAAEHWTHLITMDFPEPNIFFHITVSFLEDWRENGHAIRCVKYKNGKKRLQDGSWRHFQSARFSVSQKEASKNYNNNFNGIVSEGGYFMQSGDATCPEGGIETSKTLSCSSHDAMHYTVPEKRPIRVTNATITPSHLSWNIVTEDTPQFKYIVKDGEDTLITGVDSEIRHVDYDFSHFSKITLILEDILGNECSIVLDVSTD